MTNDTLAQALLEAVRAQSFGTTADEMQGGRAVAEFPSLDLAVVAFPPKAAPVFANVLFSREYPRGIVAEFDEEAGAVAGRVRNVQFLADQRDANGTSIAWQPGADWSRMKWEPLGGPVDAHAARFVAPYPASLLKLMVLVGVGLGADRARIEWTEPWAFGGHEVAVADWCEDMIVTSSNDATSAMVALLHARGLLGNERNVLHEEFGKLGLSTLRLDATQPDGGWGNGAGSGVGRIQMTAWDTARLLWLLDADAPAASWPGARSPLSAPSRDRVLGWLRGQGLHEILSSTLLAGAAGWRPGIPARLGARWIDANGGASVGAEKYPPDVRPASRAAEVTFAHKTGTTENYVSDAGIVQGIAPQRRHYIVALLTNLGTRYKACAPCATTWKIPALGAAIDAVMRRELEAAAR
jgi:hypothetical protein